MGEFLYLYLGKLAPDFLFVDAQRILERMNYLLPDSTSFQVGHLTTWEVLVTISSPAPLEAKILNRFSSVIEKISVTCFEYSDLYKTRTPKEKYIVCVNTKTPPDWRNIKNEELLEALWNIVLGQSHDMDIKVENGYLTLIVESKLPTDSFFRKFFKETINRFYPNSIVFEFPD